MPCLRLAYFKVPEVYPAVGSEFHTLFHGECSVEHLIVESTARRVVVNRRPQQSAALFWPNLDVKFRKEGLSTFLNIAEVHEEREDAGSSGSLKVSLSSLRTFG